MEATARAHVRVHGVVQGVFFRAGTQQTALTLGLSGWVRNLPDGGVEAVFEGSREGVAEAIEWCREGPPHAAVEGVEVSWEEPEGALGFSVRR